MPLLIPISVFAFIVLASVGVYFLVSRPQSAANNRLRELRAQDLSSEDRPQSSPVTVFTEKIAEPLNRIAPASMETAGKLQKLLIYAGFRSPKSLIVFRAIQLICLLMFPLIFIILINLMIGGLIPLMYAALIGLMIGFLAPKIVLESIMKGRQTRLRSGLADALDLMVISMEAGLGLNQALVRVSQELKFAYPEICEEFDFVNTEIRVGRDREEALRNLAERTGIDDLRGLCAMLIQADRFGTSIARAIRVYSDSMRTKRRQRAELAAQKAAVKLLFPLAAFLFPTLFIVMLGPAGIQLYDNLFR
jgi:tight adherence protein C